MLSMHILSHLSKLSGHNALNTHISAGAEHAGLVLGEQMQYDRGDELVESVRPCLACWQRQEMGRKCYGGRWWRVQRRCALSVMRRLYTCWRRVYLMKGHAGSLVVGGGDTALEEVSFSTKCMSAVQGKKVGGANRELTQSCPRALH